ncbi:hypothetical protein CYMTET_54961 [Cymbomonas tetramitiformis]|uniref:Uncharacterized protein n=1 Tax=Cymbomonas tetramitiformis TaxID=36881 RepID=A0AAE0BE61_9CHLO|nr:hypothetical protein CYMTET_54961 [Cymbomonas tetramitiformis]
MRYRPTPASPAATLTAPERTRAVAVQNSSWDVDLIKRTSRDALGTKDASFRGDESDRNVLWTSLVTSLRSAFELKDPANDTLFDSADATKDGYCPTILVKGLESRSVLSQGPDARDFF